MAVPPKTASATQVITSQHGILIMAHSYVTVFCPKFAAVRERRQCLTRNFHNQGVGAALVAAACQANILPQNGPPLGL
jgi:hypothetical protein